MFNPNFTPFRLVCNSCSEIFPDRQVRFKVKDDEGYDAHLCLECYEKDHREEITEEDRMCDKFSQRMYNESLECQIEEFMVKVDGKYVTETYYISGEFGNVIKQKQ